MEPNKNYIEGKWKEVKGEIQKTWGELTDQEIEKTKGDLTAIEGLLQQKYGQTTAHFQKQLDRIKEKFADAKDNVLESAKNKLKN